MATTLAATVEQFVCDTGTLAEGDGVALVASETREASKWTTADIATRPPVGVVVEVLSATCVLVQCTGTTPDLWTGLSRGAIYYAADAGAIATTGTVAIGVAVSDTALLLGPG